MTLKSLKISRSHVDVTDDQIWTNFVFKPSTGQGTVNQEDLETRLSCFRCKN